MYTNWIWILPNSIASSRSHSRSQRVWRSTSYHSPSSARDSCWHRASCVAGTSVCRPRFCYPDWILNSSVAFSPPARDSDSLSRRHIDPEQACDAAISSFCVSRSACHPSSCVARSAFSRWLSHSHFWQYNRSRWCNLHKYRLADRKKRNRAW